MEGETFVCISPAAWDALWRTVHHVALRLSEHNRVCYFDPGRDPDRSVLAEFINHAPNLWRLRPRHIHDRLIIIPGPPTLPHARRHLPRRVLEITMPAVVALNARIVACHVRRTMRALDIQAPILWLYSPYHASLVGQFGEKLACYFNHDEFTDFAYNQRIRDFVWRLESQLCQRVDVIFATSRAQAERRRPLNQHTYLIPNAVDYDLFHRALQPDLPLPEDVAHLPRPILGFCGWLGYHIDVPLLLRIAESYPACSLVLVGPDALPNSPALRALRKQPNVFFLGCKPPGTLPGYLKAFDVALMPWALNGHIRSAYPMKLHEYLAAGRSIVAAALPELVPFATVLRIAAGHDDFVRLIGSAWDDYAPAAVEARTAIARENTWEHRVAEMVRTMSELLAERTGHVP